MSRLLTQKKEEKLGQAKKKNHDVSVAVSTTSSKYFSLSCNFSTSPTFQWRSMISWASRFQSGEAASRFEDYVSSLPGAGRR